jgi:hypothetical protein
MPEGDAGSADPLGEFAKELAKQLPVKDAYNDVVAPPAKQVGQLATDIVKTIQLALAPIQVLGAYQDRLRTFIDRSVRRVPEQNRVSPAPQILGPIIEGIRYEPEDTPIDEMFSQLLTSAMDAERVNEAHPAFPAIIRQLASDEAQILANLAEAPRRYVWASEYDAQRNLFGPRSIEVDDLPRDGLRFGGNVPLYMDHLHQLGLAGIFQEGNQIPITADKPGTSPPVKTQIGVRANCQYRLTPWGEQFIRACCCPKLQKRGEGL